MMKRVFVVASLRSSGWRSSLFRRWPRRRRVEIGGCRQGTGSGDGGRRSSTRSPRKLPTGDGNFAAALYFPNVQLLVISGHYSAPQLMEPRLAGKQYRDTYMELSGTVTPDTKIFVQDMGEPGLVAARSRRTCTTRGHRAGKIVMFDGETDKQKMSDAEYREELHGGRRGIRAHSGRAAGRSEEIVDLAFQKVGRWWALVDSNH